MTLHLQLARNFQQGIPLWKKEMSFVTSFLYHRPSSGHFVFGWVSNKLLSTSHSGHGSSKDSSFSICDDSSSTSAVATTTTKSKTMDSLSMNHENDFIQQFHRDILSSSSLGKEPRSQQRKFQVWWDQFEELYKFYQTHGHCNVPSSNENRELVKFVISQRKAYKAQTLQRDPHSSWKIQVLKSIGFQFDPLEDAWREKFHELTEYVKQHGDCLLPQHDKEHPQLAKWVHEQRVQYRLLLNYNNTNSYSFMTWDRVDALESIGFIWEVHDYIWEEHVKEFRDFYQRYGHGLVPQNHGKLGRWVSNVRQDYRKWTSSSSSSGKTMMTNQRFLALQEEGFIWDVHEYKWQEKCAAVCTFRNLLGRWPSKKDDPSLGLWIKKQKGLYQKYQQQQQQQQQQQHQSEGKTSNITVLTSKRAKILEQIGLISSSVSVDQNNAA